MSEDLVLSRTDPGNSGVLTSLDVNVFHKQRQIIDNEVGDPMDRVAAGIRSTHGEDGAIVLDVERGQIFGFNRVGSRILELLEAGCSEPAIVAMISQQFGHDPKSVAQDVGEFLSSLRKHRLLLDGSEADRRLPAGR